MVFLKKKYNKKLFLGIDFGTTYSLVTTIQNEHIVFLLDEKKHYLFPSIAHYKKKEISVGWQAQKNLLKDACNTISSVKRLIGRSIEFIKNTFPELPYIIENHKNEGIILYTNYGFVTPIDVVSHILKDLKKRSESFFNQKINASIITVPAYFNNIQRMAIKKAADLADMNIIRLLNEPTSAAIAYGLQKNNQGIVLVYDLGGGTFDVSILKLNQGIFEVLATGGDSNLGGDDFDVLLACYIYKKSKLKNQRYNLFQSSLLKIAKETKLKLTDYENVKIHFHDWEGSINRTEFNLIIQKLIKKTLLICSKIIQDIDLSIHDIKEVIMVGGSTRIPLISKEVSRYFQKKVLSSINPDQVVAMGAAIQSNMLISNNIKNKTILLDIIPLSLGIEVMGGFVEKVIFRNSRIPISKTKEFTTSKDNQTSILIHVLQGERELVKDCISLSRFILTKIPPKQAGTIRILVTFEIDSDGLINVKACEKNSNREKKIQIDHSIGLKNKDVSKIIENSLMYAKEDYFYRIKLEKKMESEKILNILQNSLNAHQNIISSEELLIIKKQQKKLQKSIEKDDFFSMKLNLKKLEIVSKRFFSLQLKKVISSSIKNTLNEIT